MTDPAHGEIEIAETEITDPTPTDKISRRINAHIELGGTLKSVNLILVQYSWLSAAEVILLAAKIKWPQRFFVRKVDHGFGIYEDPSGTYGG